MGNDRKKTKKLMKFVQNIHIFMERTYNYSHMKRVLYVVSHVLYVYGISRVLYVYVNSSVFLTKLKRNNLGLRYFFEIKMPLWRRRQTFRFMLVTTTCFICVYDFTCFYVYLISRVYMCMYMISRVYMCMYMISRVLFVYVQSFHVF